MATSVALQGFDIVKGRSQSTGLNIGRVTFTVTGTYVHAAPPSVNLVAAMQQAHCASTSVNVKRVFLFEDGTDGTNLYTLPNASITSSTVNAGSTNDKAAVLIFSGVTQGDTGGAEISDGTVLNHTFALGFVFSGGVS